MGNLGMVMGWRSGEFRVLVVKTVAEEETGSEGKKTDASSDEEPDRNLEVKG